MSQNPRLCREDWCTIDEVHAAHPRPERVRKARAQRPKPVAKRYKGRPRDPAVTEKAVTIRALMAQGRTIAEAAAHLGLTKRRADKILRSRPVKRYYRDPNVNYDD